MSRRRSWPFIATLLAGLWTATAAFALPPVWVVKGKDAEVVLFGSVHILPPNLEWRPPALVRALKDADEVWFEIPVDAATARDTARIAAAKGALPADQSLFKQLAPADARALLAVAKAYDVSPALLDRLQPWMAEIALAGGAYRKAGADSDDGVEQAVAAAAPPAALRRAFETPAEQIDMLAGGTFAEQAASLRETVQEMQDEPDEFGILVRAWMAGDIAVLDREALEPIRRASPALFQRLVTARNIRWTQMLDARLKGHGRTVVVVGIGHLIGAGSVPARLRALGYSVTGP